jgi:chromosome segregation ATPase
MDEAAPNGSEARRRARERIKQRRIAKQVVSPPLVGVDGETAESADDTQDVRAMMMQMMEQMTEQMEVTAERAVQNAMDRSARTEPVVDTGMAERLAAAETQVAQLQADNQELEMIRHQKSEMDAQLERMSQQYHEFGREKQELELELRRMGEQLTLALKAAEPVPGLRDENESLRTRKAVLETEVQRLHEQLSSAEMAASPIPQLRDHNESLRLKVAVLETELGKEREAAAHRAVMDADARERQESLAAEARERHEALAAELTNITQDLHATESDLESEIEANQGLKKSNAVLQQQLAQYKMVAAENQTLKADQDLLTQELKRMQVEALQLKQKVTVAAELTGTAGEIAHERDELRRTITELKDEHTLQLAELQTELNAAQNATEDAHREAVGLAHHGGAVGAEAAELQKRNAELLAQISELEEDLAQSDADLEQAITKLEANGITLDDDMSGDDAYNDR